MIVTLVVLLDGQTPFVVNVIVYVFSVLALKSINPVVIFKKTKPLGTDVNVPLDPPVIVAVGSTPVWHNVDGV